MTQSSEPGALHLGPIGDKVIFENDTVRVWIVDLDAGARQAWHEHHLPYLVVPLTDGKNVMNYISGKVVHTDEKPGMALWREAGEPHELLNTSSWHYRNILIEFKQAIGTPEHRG